MSTPVVLSVVVGKPGPVRLPGEKTRQNVRTCPIAGFVSAVMETFEGRFVLRIVSAPAALHLPE
jgi:hypothetical protein